MLTGMNYDNKTIVLGSKDILEEVQRVKGSDNGSSTSGSSTKIKPATLEANEEALLAA